MFQLLLVSTEVRLKRVSINGLTLIQCTEWPLSLHCITYLLHKPEQCTYAG
jgi:hypothetical protein